MTTSDSPQRSGSLRLGRRAALTAAALAPFGALGLTGCTDASVRLAEETNAIPDVDLSAITKQDAIAALVPEKIRAAGELVNGAATNYAPGEFLSNGIPVGYDIDVLAAIGKVLGLETRTESAVFAQIIPSIGSKYDVGISGFTINDERLQTVNMVSYFEAGISYAVAEGNPYGIDPHDLCGKRPAVQVGTYQEEMMTALDQECRDAGKKGLDVLSYASNNDAVTNVAGGKADILVADSPVTAYAIARSRGTLEQVGQIEDSALNGICVAKSDTALTEAICQAVQHLIDEGHLLAIMTAWGNESGMIEKAEINPAS